METIATKAKPLCLTGIKPTGELHFGNYFGAIKPSLQLMEKQSHDFAFFLADYHAQNSRDVFKGKSREDFSRQSFEMCCAWLALGLSPNQCSLYLQSSIPQIGELFVILANFTAKGLLNRAHSYKDATAKNLAKEKDPDHQINMGLYLYPLLMTVDILLFNAAMVPVGIDQKQHLEMCRDIAQVFNHSVGEKIFEIPSAYFHHQDLLFPGTDGRKMSKSYQNTLPIFAPSSKIKKLINTIATDSSAPTDPKDPNTSLLFAYYQWFASQEKVEILKGKFAQGIGWGDVKQMVFDEIELFLRVPREKYQQYLSNPHVVKDILQAGKKTMLPRAERTLMKVKEALGILN